jgi:hypothetical protein
MSVTARLQHYKELRPQMDTGDVLLFQGTGPISRAIRLGTRLTGNPGKVSHVGMVYKLDNVLLCWESTTLSSGKDVILGRPVRGVRLSALSHILQVYPGQLWWRPLVGERLPLWRDAVDQCRMETHGIPYELSLLNLAKSALSISWCQPVFDLTSVFCSELLAYVYRATRVLDGPEPPGAYIPDDFLPGRLADKRLVAPWAFGSVRQLV